MGVEFIDVTLGKVKLNFLYSFISILRSFRLDEGDLTIRLVYFLQYS